jgi:hypothetical protein
MAEIRFCKFLSAASNWRSVSAVSDAGRVRVRAKNLDIGRGVTPELSADQPAVCYQVNKVNLSKPVTFITYRYD